MEYPEMLQELWEMLQDYEIYNDDCDHENPARPEASEGDFCQVCFILNLYQNCSDGEPEFLEETTQAQRDVLESLWERYCNGGDYD